MPGLIWATGRVVRGRSVPGAVVLVVVAVVFVVGPQWLLPTGGSAELHWNPLQVLVGDAYVWIGLLFVVGSAVRSRAARARRPAAVAVA